MRAYVFESDGVIINSPGSGKTKIWSLRGAEMSPREANPGLMSSGEQRLIRTDGGKEVGAADFGKEEWIHCFHPNRQERTRRKLGGFRTSELVSLRSLKRFKERPISTLLVIIPPQISAELDPSQGKHDVLTGAGAILIL